MEKRTKTFWYGVRDEKTSLDGEEFFVEADSKETADKIVERYFPHVHVSFFGRVSEYFAECMGYDTY